MFCNWKNFKTGERDAAACWCKFQRPDDNMTSLADLSTLRRGDWVVESGIKCTSLACSVFYERRKVQKELQGLASVAAGNGFLS
ncbi:hypothetical protein Prudu_018238 [Prunus dulcis]|uniref:Uncharacterized protein n=1 Tax=Prunus dulcis TaxID=3755 RepID=A0A4Y1RQB4_PRUDU|nr:hypothetical protein Prudu_018238 [Prunus dulcis]